MLRFLPQNCRALAALLLLPALPACDPNRIFEENTDFKNYSWDVQQKPGFTFTIPDTAARYDIYFNVRNAADYGYYNLYVKHTLRGPDGGGGRALLHHMILMDPKTGEPRGDGSGDIFDHEILALPDQKFSSPGPYTITLEQYMRQDQLPGLMAIGVQVKKKGN